ncbi:uncharacterized protein BO96DRAFT_113976 [Aspergillus niger CBS 101883]|uniref:uncharacterized protein n=1 Tax=Aspergillus lacticoffeatus (strain CBS 101883) TaxID=1450533 RepID=UPI000D7F8A93|nr:uncharacterized protein BO96DRAFT_113976 [Aspergillus niger CBS 101883]PYH53948.1 hypothetical protein BO96DRAFT_113976 [Aspergillus niger CBS 101883]
MSLFGGTTVERANFSCRRNRDRGHEDKHFPRPRLVPCMFHLCLWSCISCPWVELWPIPSAGRCEAPQGSDDSVEGRLSGTQTLCRPLTSLFSDLMALSSRQLEQCRSPLPVPARLRVYTRILQEN